MATLALFGKFVPIKGVSTTADERKELLELASYLKTDDGVTALENATCMSREHLLPVVVQWLLSQLLASSKESIEWQVVGLLNSFGWKEVSLSTGSKLLEKVVQMIKCSSTDEQLQHALVLVTRLFSHSNDNEFEPNFGVYKPPTDAALTFLLDTLAAVYEKLDKSSVSLAEAALKIFYKLQLLHSNKKKVFALAVKSIVRPFIKYRSAFIAYPNVISLMDSIVNNALFHPDLLDGYSGTTFRARSYWEGSEEGVQKKQHMSFQRMLFEELEACISSSDKNEFSNVSSFLASLISGFTDSFRSFLSEALPRTVPTKRRKKASSSSSAVSGSNTGSNVFWFWLENFTLLSKAVTDKTELMLAVRTQFQILVTKDIYRAADDTNDQSQYKILGKLAQELLQHSVTLDIELSIYELLPKVSPGLLEPVLPKLLVRCVSKDMPSCDKFFSVICESYGALRGIDDMIDLFNSQAAASDIKGFCSWIRRPVCKAALESVFRQLPQGQVQPIWTKLVSNVMDATDKAFSTTVLSIFSASINLCTANPDMIHSMIISTFESVVVKSNVMNYAYDLVLLKDRARAWVQFDEPATLKLLKTVEAALETKEEEGLVLLSIAYIRLCNALQSEESLRKTNTRIIISKLMDRILTFVEENQRYSLYLENLQPLSFHLDASMATKVVEWIYKDVNGDNGFMSLLCDAAFFEIDCYRRPLASVLVTNSLKNVAAIEAQVFCSIIPISYWTREDISMLLEFALKVVSAAPARKDVVKSFIKWVSCIVRRREDSITDEMLLQLVTWTCDRLKTKSSGEEDEVLLKTLLNTERTMALPHVKAYLQSSLEEASSVSNNFVAVLVSHLSLLWTKCDLSNLLPSINHVWKLTETRLSSSAYFATIAALLQFYAASRKVTLKDKKTANALLLQVEASLKDACSNLALHGAQLLLVSYCVNVGKVDKEWLNPERFQYILSSLLQALEEVQQQHASSNVIANAIEGLVTRVTMTSAQYETILSTIRFEMSVGNATSRRQLAILRFLRIILRRVPRDKDCKSSLQKNRPMLLQGLVKMMMQCSAKEDLVVSSIIKTICLFYTKSSDTGSSLSEVQLTLATSLRPLHQLEGKNTYYCHQIWMFSYMILSKTIKMHAKQMPNLAPVVMQGVQSLFEVLCRREKSHHQYSRIWCMNLSRLCSAMVLNASSVFRKHAVYVLIQYFNGVSTGSISLEMAALLRDGVFSLLDLCSKHETSQLHTLLDSTGKQLFKTIHDDYKQNHVYHGRS